MKKILLSALLLVLPVLCLAQVKQSTDIYIVNRDGQVKIKAADGTMSVTGLPWLEFTDGTNDVFTVPSTGILPVAYGGTGVATTAALQALLTNAPTSGITAIANGGTGEATAHSAITNLGINEIVTNATVLGYRRDLGLSEFSTNSTAFLFRGAIGATELVTNTAAQMKVALGIDAGWTNTTADGLAIIKFGQTFSAAPAVTVTPTGTNITAHVESVTTSLATVYLSATNGLYWTAIGAP